MDLRDFMNSDILKIVASLELQKNSDSFYTTPKGRNGQQRLGLMYVLEIQPSRQL